MAGNTEITDPEQVYRGCYAVVAIDVKTNGATGTNTRGLYINSRGIQMVGHGERIMGGANPDELFGATAAIPAGAYVPAGMTNTPPAPAMAVPVSPAPAMVAPTMAAAQPQVQTPAPAPAVPTMAPPTLPHPTFVQQAVAPTYVLTPHGQAQGFTIQQWLDGGHSEATLLESGIITNA